MNEITYQVGPGGGYVTPCGAVFEKYADAVEHWEACKAQARNQATS
jgi:hypothetical protein